NVFIGLSGTPAARTPNTCPARYGAMTSLSSRCAIAKESGPIDPGPTRIPHRQSIPTLTEPPLGTVLPNPKMRPKWGETHANPWIRAKAILVAWRKIDQFSAHGSAHPSLSVGFGSLGAELGDHPRCCLVVRIGRSRRYVG